MLVIYYRWIVPVMLSSQIILISLMYPPVPLASFRAYHPKGMGEPFLRLVVPNSSDSPFPKHMTTLRAKSVLASLSIQKSRAIRGQGASERGKKRMTRYVNDDGTLCRKRKEWPIRESGPPLQIQQQRPNEPLDREWARNHQLNTLCVEGSTHSS